MCLMNDNHNLVADNMNLVYYIISKEYPTYLHDDDIVQSGFLGLCQAAKRWDAERGTFANFAGKWIRGEIKQEFIRRKTHSKNISMETDIGDDGTLADVLQGDDDVEYIDDDTFRHQLSQEEREVLQLESDGYSTAEMAEMVGLSINKVRQLRRVIRLKWKNYYDA